DALWLVAERARLIAELPPGAMTAMALSPEDALSLLAPSLSIAAVNGPELCVASGPVESIEALEASLSARGVACRRLGVGHAFHSPLMRPVASALEACVERLHRSPPRTRY